jgi:methionyl-tRNA formyltransferase
MGKTVSRNDRIHHPDAVRLRREQSGQRRLRAGDAEAKWIRTYPTEVSGLWKELPTEVVEEVSARADLVFPRGFGLLRGDILSATEYGVLSYHHGDPRKYRGGPAGFWEFMNDEETAGMMVQALSSDLDAGRVYAYDEIDIQEYQSWEEIRWALYLRSIRLLAEAVTTVQDETKEPMMIDELGPVYHPPSAVDLSKFCFKRLRESAVAPSPSEG